MTQQVINIGAAVEDGTGDPQRTSFDKCNQNFTELYNASALDSPTFTGDPKAPTPATADNDTSIATTAFVKAQNYITSTALTSYAPLASPTFTGNPTAPTPTAGDNDTSIATTAFVTTAIAGKADTSALAAKADLASPTFSGDPKAPTPTAGDNDTSIATTAFVTTAISTGVSGLAALASPTFTGDPKAPTPTAGDNDTSIATTAFVMAAVAAVGGGAVSPPQGRLTLQTDTPVMTTTQSAKTTIYYTPYVGNLVPIYNGTSFAMTAFSELSVLTTDATKSPAAIGVNKVNDWFVWNDAGTLRIGHGPDWTNDTTPSGTGTRPGLVMVNGIPLNNAAITNGPAAQRGTYVGTTHSNASSQLDWIYGAIAAGGTAGVFGVWNVYNRVYVTSLAGDLADSWTYNVIAVRAANAKTTMRHSFVCGLAEDCFTADYKSMHHPTTFNTTNGIGYDVTNAFSGRMASNLNPASITLSGDFSTTALGYHFFQACESGDTGGGTFYGDNGSTALFQTGLTFAGWM
jgi:hypothetical protein